MALKPLKVSDSKYIFGHVKTVILVVYGLGSKWSVSETVQNEVQSGGTVVLHDATAVADGGREQSARCQLSVSSNALFFLKMLLVWSAA